MVRPFREIPKLSAFKHWEVQPGLRRAAAAACRASVSQAGVACGMLLNQLKALGRLRMAVPFLTLLSFEIGRPKRRTTSLGE